MVRLFILLACWLLTGHAFATHILGGYIQARQLPTGTMTYEITVRLFMDEQSGRQAIDQQNTILLCVGDRDRTVEAVRVTKRLLNPSVSLSIYRLVYTYEAAATRTLSVALQNRSNGMRNLPDKASEEAFYIETTISTALNNTTPDFAIPDTFFQGRVGTPFVAPLQATDPEGDSLVYSLAASRLGTCNVKSTALAGFVFPHDVARQGTFKITPRQGELTWNAPTEQGRYVVVVRAEEWRRGQRISESYLDMTVAVTDQAGSTPVTIPPYEPAFDGALITGLTDTVGDGEVSIVAYPVPVQDQLLVRLRSAQPVTARMQIFNAVGQIVRELDLSTPATEHETPFDTSQWGAGTYLIRTYTMGKAYTNKVVKQ